MMVEQFVLDSRQSFKDKHVFFFGILLDLCNLCCIQPEKVLLFNISLSFFLNNPLYRTMNSQTSE